MRAELELRANFTPDCLALALSIETETPKLFENLIERYHVPSYSTVYLNSPGGNLYAGMELGRVIRKNGLYTAVGKLSEP